MTINPGPDAQLARWQRFRTSRNRALASGHGWLTLTSLQWLESEPSAVELAPGRWSTDGTTAFLTADAAEGLTLVDSGAAVDGNPEGDYAEFANTFRMLEGETLAGLLESYEQVAAHTDELVRTLPDLTQSLALPEAPWFEPGARWTARRVFMHLVAEIAQHAGHADILRESIDGQKSMG